MSDLRSIARALNGEVVSGGVNFPGPGHGRSDRSARLLLGSQYQDGFHVFSWAGDNWQYLKDYVRDRLGWHVQSFPCPERRTPASGNYRIIPYNKGTRRALEIWHGAQDPRGTIVETYLTRPKAEGGRGLSALPDEVAGRVLRFHPACPWRDSDTDPVIFVPAMIAAMRNFRKAYRASELDQITAVHRTRLTADGCKVSKPKMLGPSACSAIKIDPDEDVMQGIVIGEGVETCLSARQLGYQPVWALGSATAIAKFPVLTGIECVAILAERDANGTNENAISALAKLWYEADREVLAIDPKMGKDINDVIGRRA